MKNNKIILFTGLLLLIFTSCIGFHEGPVISFKSAPKRFVGIWKVKHFYVDDVDSIDKFRAELNDTILILRYIGPRSYLAYNEIENSFYIPKYRNEPLNQRVFYMYTYYWKWNNFYVHKINFTRTLIPYSYTFEKKTLTINTNTIDFKIKKLTSKKFFLETTVNGKKYRMEMEKIADYGKVEIHND